MTIPSTDQPKVQKTIPPISAAPTAKKDVKIFPRISPWGAEFLKRLDKLHKVMAEEGVKFVPA